MAEYYVIPPFAKKLLPGLTIKSVSETAPHCFSLEFTDGSILHTTGMPFSNGTLDVAFIEGADFAELET